MKILLVLMCSTIYSQASWIKVNLQLDEDGSYYNQTEEYDLLTGDVITSVPAHWRDGLLLHESHKIENERLGLTVWKLAEDKVCHLEKLDSAEHPTEFVLEVATLEARNITMDSSMMT